jgi:integrase
MRDILKAAKVESLEKKPIAGNYYDGEKLYLCVSPKGKLSWRYRIEVNSKRTWVTFGRFPQISLAEARALALEYSKLAVKGLNPREHLEKQKELNITITELCKEYMELKAPVVRKKPNSLADHMRIIKNEIIAHIGSYRLSELTLPLIQRKLIQPRQLDSPASAKRNVITLNSIINYAIDVGYLEKNPIPRKTITSIHKDGERERYLNFDELTIVLNAVLKSSIRWQFKACFVILLLTGCRKQEIMDTTFEQLSLSSETLYIPENKTNEPFQVPLPKQAIILFKILKEINGNFKYIFAGKSGGRTGHNTLNQVLRFSGLLLSQPYTVHDIRRTYATTLSELNYTPDLIELALNHKRKGMERVYQRSNLIEQRRIMGQKLADKIQSFVEPELWKSFISYNKECVG